MIKNILAPLDGSKHSQKALEFACDLANQYDARLHLLHIPQAASQQQVFALGSAAITMESSPQELESAGRSVIDAAKQICKDQGCKHVDAEIVSGSPAEMILERAKEHQADMIVMGSRGLSNLAGLLMGSVSHKVSHLAECTCVTVR